MLNKSRGRPKGKPDTRTALIKAAAQAFHDQGYASTSMRSIARNAGVDPSLLNYHFGSKSGLFVAVMAFEFSPAEVLGRALREPGPPARRARALLTGFVDAWDNSERLPVVMSLLRDSIAEPEGRRLLTEYIEREILGQLSATIGGRHATERAAPVAVLMAGLVFTRYALELEPIASMPRDQFVKTFAPVLAMALGG